MLQPNYTILRTTDDILRLARNYTHIRAEIRNLMQVGMELEFGKHDTDEIYVNEAGIASDNISARADSAILVLQKVKKKLDIFLKAMKIYQRRK